MSSVELDVNGTKRQLDVDADTPLAYILRNDLGLKSVKIGCELEQCGACRVLVDGEAKPSCVTPVGSLVGRAITTLEGIAPSDGMLSAVQRSLLDHNAAQCGYCLSGIVITLEALFRRDPHPDEASLRTALDDNLCRCGAHPRILRAMRALAKET